MKIRPTIDFLVGISQTYVGAYLGYFRTGNIIFDTGHFRPFSGLARGIFSANDLFKGISLLGVGYVSHRFAPDMVTKEVSSTLHIFKSQI